ncbi:MarR family winged helix-turn-helix transcriptional regulator [Paenibacillus agricola]|uniref:MarR family transcriptional regulator n=1 Tax=Paenibacillus agricola TaxID=2716264 RepID=A0ABX0JB95_9BACL|nr:MarR family transcriptional regulator [Paenibacillus agricola]NHN33407.1 MarR family transcriptional regulator [Paenibacillus agricola]
MNESHDTNDSIGVLISQTARRLNQLLTSKFQSFDITSEQWSLLLRLAKQDGITQKELAIRSFKDPTNVTRILDQLERKGWIQRVQNNEDRRSFLTYVTEQGRLLNEQLLPVEAEFLNNIGASLSDGDLSQLRKTLTQINTNIDASLKTSLSK